MRSRKNGAIGAQGTTITFSWSGYDPKLQKRTAGLRSFDLQYRVNGGSWRTIRDNTTATSITLNGPRPRALVRVPRPGRRPAR